MDFTTSSSGSTHHPRHRRVVANPLGGRHHGRPRPQEAEEEEAAEAPNLFDAGESDADAVHNFWDEWGDSTVAGSSAARRRTCGRTTFILLLVFIPVLWYWLPLASAPGRDCTVQTPSHTIFKKPT